MQNILLTIAIPTFNRAEWLKLCLSRLVPQLIDINDEVEIAIYDNASPDHTESVAKSFLDDRLPIKYFRNAENIGSDRNIAQCFNNAVGRYVLILGDDDVVIDQTLKKIVGILKNSQYDHGAIYMRAYGYDVDFLKERPFQFFRRSKVYTNADDFMCRCSNGMAFISSLIINKSRIPSVDANQFINTALVQTYLFYEAVRSSETNLFIDEYLIAAKRIEQRDYDVTKIFASSLNNALDFFVSRGLSRNTVLKINRRLLWYFFPFFLLQLRLSNAQKKSAEEAYTLLKYRYHKEFFFWICAAPILKWPANLAKIWAMLIIVFSRLISGEFGRLYVLLRGKASRLLGLSFKVDSK